MACRGWSTEGRGMQEGGAAGGVARRRVEHGGDGAAWEGHAGGRSVEEGRVYRRAGLQGRGLKEGGACRRAEHRGGRA